jgi:hypothetical protein
MRNKTAIQCAAEQTLGDRLCDGFQGNESCDATSHVQALTCSYISCLNKRRLFSKYPSYIFLCIIMFTFIHYTSIHNTTYLFSPSSPSHYMFRPHTAIIRCLFAKTVPLCGMSNFSYHM